MNLQNLKLVLHIGYHKTGTTFFQNVLFNNHPQIAFLGRSWIDKQLNTIFYDLASLKKSEFDPAILRERFDVLVSNLIKNGTLSLEGKKVLMISHESLHSGLSYFGFTLEEQAKRINLVFPEAKVLISIRKQPQMIESHYTNYIHHGGTLSFNRFYNKSDIYNLGLKHKLNYFKICNLYFELFDKSNVQVLVFEHIFSGNLNLTRFYDFLDLQKIDIQNNRIVNRRLTKTSIFFVRMINLILLRDFNTNYNNRLAERHSVVEKIRWQLIRLLKSIERLSGFSAYKRAGYLSESQKKDIATYYTESNRQLSELIEFDLETFKY